MVMCQQHADHKNTTVVLERTARSLRVVHAPLALQMQLQTRQWEAEADGPHGYRQHAVAVPLYHKNEDGSLRLSPALTPAVEAALQPLGCSVKREAYDLLPLLPPMDRTAFARLRVEDEPFFDVVQQHTQGLIRYRIDSVRPSLLIAQLALAYPTQTFVIAATRVADAHRLGRELRTLLGQDTVTVLTGDDNPCAMGRVVVGTYIGLTQAAVELEHRDFLIYLDAREGVSRNGRLPLDHAYRARVIGLLPDSATVSPLEQDKIRAVLGFAEAMIPQHNHHERGVQAAQPLRITQPSLPLAQPNPYVLKQQGVYRHHHRNRRVVQKAKQSLLQADRNGQAKRIIVLVDDVEHGLALSLRLPGWPVVAEPDCCLTGLMQQARKRLRQGDAQRYGEWQGAIVTTTALAEVNLATVGVVIRTDGGTGLPALPPEQLVVANQQKREPLQLVDVDDRHHPTLRQWSKDRRQAYRMRGWFAPGDDPIVERAKMFLESRPDVRRLLTRR